MGVMEKMRNSTGIILWVLIFSFGILWMLQDTQVFDAVGRAPSSLGSVNGEPISNSEYQQQVNFYVNRYNEQSGNSMTPSIRTNFEDRAWNQLVTGKILEQKMNELGIIVTDQELIDMITGPNPAPFIRQQFGREDGSINRAALNAAIESEQNSRVWIAIEQQLSAQRRQQKMNTFVQASMQVSAYEVKQQYIRNNTTANIEFVRFPYASISESDIQISDNELEDYYDEHQDQFQQDEAYEFKYVTFSKTATEQDTARTIQELKNLRQDFAEAQNDSLFLVRYQSAVPYNPVFVDKEDIEPLYEPVLDLADGEVSNLIKEDGQLYLLKKLEEQANQIKFVVLSYTIRPDPIATIDERAREADDFSFFANQESFENEATRLDLSVEETSATKGADFIAGLGQSPQVLDILEDSEQGEISNPIELTNAFIVLKVTNIIPEGTRPFEEVEDQIETIVFNEKRKEQLAQKVSEMLQSNNNLQSLAQTSGNEVESMQNLRMSSETIAGAGREPGVIGAVFGLETGEISQAIKGTSAVFVVKVEEIQPAEPSEMNNETARQIREELQQQKAQSFTQVWLAQLKEQAEIEDHRSQVLR